MHATNPAIIFTQRFDAVGIRYMVTGSVAATLYGEPRLTNDVDIVAVILDGHLAPLANAFPLDEFYLPPEEVIRVEAARTHRGHFNIIHHATGFKADVYLAGRDVLHDWGLEHTRKIEIDGITVSIAPPEYVIVRKLEFYREGESEKHLRDIRAMVEALSSDLDTSLIATIANERGLDEIWKQIIS